VHRFASELWVHHGDAAWHFLTLPGDVSDDIEARTSETRRGFGSVRVRVTVGSTVWTTSVFPDSKAAAYVLPVKKEVRRAEGLEAGSRVHVALDVLDA
jgi:hypothetical protein